MKLNISNTRNHGIGFKSARTSTTTIALLLVAVLLASSTIYLSYLMSQPKTGSSLPRDVTAAGPTNNVTSSPNSITVIGTGQASYTPNEAIIQVSVQTQNTTAVAATSLNAQKVSSVINTLNGIGIPNSSIQTQGYSLSANYASCYSACVPQIIGYTVTNSLQVNITSNDPTQLGLKAGHVIDSSVNAGANGISLSFGASSSVLGDLTNSALQNAVASADSQAHAIAGSLGVSITGVISATEGNSYYPVPYATNAVFAASAAVQTPIIPGTQTISATVQVVYSIS